MLLVVVGGVVGHVAAEEVADGGTGDVGLEAGTGDVVVDLTSGTVMDNQVA